MASTEKDSSATEKKDVDGSGANDTGEASPSYIHHNSTTRALVVVLTVVVVVAGIVFVYPYVTKMFGKQKEVISSVDQLMKRDQTLARQIKELELTLKSFEDERHKQLASIEDVRALERKVEQLESLPQAVQQSTGALSAVDAQLKSTVQQLTEQVAKLEADQVVLKNKIKQIPLILQTFANLRRAVYSGGPFDEEFAKIKLLMETENASINARLEALAKHANSGIPTISSLRREFVKLTREIVEASEEKPEGWWTKFKSYIKGSVVIRRTDSEDGAIETVRDLIAAIEASLESDNLKEVLDLVAEIPAQDLEALKEWRKKAQLRLAILNNVAELESIAVGGTEDSSEKDSN